MVAQQLQVCLQNDIDPIICIGETKEERDNGKTDHLLVSQLHTILGNAEGELKSIQIAYEPRWAIGTGNPVNPEEAERVHQLIKHTLKEYIPADTDIPILYGGSVNAENILSFLEQGSVDGALIGSASANESSLREIIETLAKLNN
jgi:triosephosphate isomerase